MQIGAITSYIDVAQMSLYAFWLFFFGLIYYLRREDKREGYPLVTEKPGERVEGFPFLPAPKTYRLEGGQLIQAPRPESQAAAEPTFDAQPAAMWPGAPLQPMGNPMLSGAGPAASALRPDQPEYVQETDVARIVPLRVATDHFLDADSPNPIGQEVIGADGLVAGTVVDLWVDRYETMIRYIEVEVAGGRQVLVPKPLAKVGPTGRVVVASALAAQFADAPSLANPYQVTLLEEERIQAYFGSGHLYATPSRVGPLL